MCHRLCVVTLTLTPGVEAEHAAATDQQEVVVVEHQPEEEEMMEAQTAVVSVVDAGSQEVLHQVHFTMEVDGTTQEQQVIHKCVLLAKSLVLKIKAF